MVRENRKRTSMMATSSLLTLTSLVPMAKDHTTLWKTKANQSKLFCVTMLTPDGKSLGRAAHTVLSPTRLPGGKRSSGGPTHPFPLPQERCHQAGGWARMCSKQEEGLPCSTAGRLCHLKLFRICWLLFLMLLLLLKVRQFFFLVVRSNTSSKSFK